MRRGLGEDYLVLRLEKARLGEPLRGRADAILVSAAVIKSNVPRDILCAAGLPDSAGRAGLERVRPEHPLLQRVYLLPGMNVYALMDDQKQG